MRTLVKISWRNIWRNPKRSLVMIVAIAVGLWAGIATTSLMFGMLDQRFKTGIEQHISHLQIHNPAFVKDNNLNNGIENWEALFEDLSSDIQVKAFSGRTKVMGMLATASQTQGITINGIDPEMETQTTNLGSNIFSGSYLDESKRNQVLVGSSLAEKNKLQERSRIVMTFQDERGEMVSAAFRVAGIFQTANAMFDEQNVFVLQSDLRELVSKRPIISEIAVMLNNLEWVNQKRERIASAFEGITVRTWAEISPDLAIMQTMSEAMLIIILGIILLALAFGLVNTMLMSVYERVPELGMLMAVGMNKKKIFLMISLETIFLSLVGAVGGMLVGFLTVKWLGAVGIDFAKVGGESLSDFGYDSVVYPTIQNSVFVIITTMVLLTSLITSIFPSLKALKLKPAEAVKVE